MKRRSLASLAPKGVKGEKPPKTMAKAPLFSGAAPHPHKNLGRFLHSSKKK